ncbi:hypothetical protein HN695_02115 [Candidatus Woesearchaeota archaeon]|jgi:hypothetical protein|nr:hypothetical protein [Candidatus Woesearchaeota archaeon]MBT5272882.1 hypothetical protein [Candidatus Woesearchaeota archaeon]MBT6041348.1 hypothetical protein [Candidatus Woesearchaeota archaeon]MBT6337231.1 hypothetical protein [Candidatus Woesearchaeota archaeon]MBT7927108.1 hypothetical protein [Candidatus Woesearchaeota archaeon]
MAKDTICGIVLKAETDSNREDDRLWEKDTSRDEEGFYVCKLNGLYEELFSALRHSKTGDLTSYEQVSGIGRNDTTTRKGFASGASCMIYVTYQQNDSMFDESSSISVYLVDFRLERSTEDTRYHVQRVRDKLREEHPLLDLFTESELKYNELTKFKEKEGKALEIISF